MPGSPEHLPPMLEKIVSGGQTGVDRAALDVAMRLGVAHGGWCPRGRLAEDGVIPEKYRLRETAESSYPVRTERNVLDSDGTLIIYRGRMIGGTELTRRSALQHAKPCMAVDLQDDEIDVARVLRWIVRKQICVLNVAGPRESSSPGIGQAALEFLHRLLGAA